MFIHKISFTQIIIRLISFVDTPNAVTVFDNTPRARSCAFFSRWNRLQIALFVLICFAVRGLLLAVCVCVRVCVCVCVCVCVLCVCLCFVCGSTRVTTIRRLTCCVWLTVASH
jgi:hypothetical protein